MKKFKVLLDAFGAHSGLIVNLPLICRLAGRSLGEMTAPMHKAWFESIPTQKVVTRVLVAFQTEITDHMTETLDDKNQNDSFLRMMFLNCLAHDKMSLIGSFEFSRFMSEKWAGRVLGDKQQRYFMSLFPLCDHSNSVYLFTFSTNKYRFKLHGWAASNECNNENCDANIDIHNWQSTYTNHDCYELSLISSISNWRDSSQWSIIKIMAYGLHFLTSQIKLHLLCYFIPEITTLILTCITDNKPVIHRNKIPESILDDVLKEPLPHGVTIKIVEDDN